MSRWDIKGWLGLQLIAILLFSTWFFGYWQWLDEKFFWSVNDQLQNPSFAWLVAFLNQRWIDGVVAGLMLLVMLHRICAVSNGERRRLIALSIIMVAAFLVQVAVGLFTEIKRPSPTNAFPGVLRVSKLVPHLSLVKDGSSNAFPSDHGIGLTTFALFTWHGYPRRYFYLAAPLAVIFALPRMLSGAHWLTDFICGSVPLALITGAWLFHTPLAAWLTVKISGALETSMGWWRNR